MSYEMEKPSDGGETVASLKSRIICLEVTSVLSEEYRQKMEYPMICLASMFNLAGDAPSDPELVKIAARKIKVLKQMLVAAGFNEKLLDVIMNDV